ncbi:MAG: hypothetical protein ABI833_11975 [Acidobacteriota bacterium]
MNTVLLMILIAEACLGVCAWLTPNCLRHLAAHLLTRADVVEAAKAESCRRIQFWRDELGVAHESLAATVDISESAVSRPVRN